MKYKIQGTPLLVGDSASESLVVKFNQPISAGCPKKGKGLGYVAVLSKEEQKICEKALKPNENPGWLDPSNTEFWDNFVYTVYGDEHVFDTSIAEDLIGLRIFESIGLVAKPNTDKAQSASFLIFALGNEKEANKQLVDKFLELNNKVQAYTTVGERLGFVLFTTQRSKEVFSERPSLAEIAGVFKSYVGSPTLDETKINTIISELHISDEDLLLEIIWYAGLFFNHIKDGGERSKNRFSFTPKNADVKGIVATTETKFRAKLAEAIKVKNVAVIELINLIKSEKAND